MLAGHKTLLHVAHLQVVQGQHVLLLFLLRTRKAEGTYRNHFFLTETFSSVMQRTALCDIGKRKGDIHFFVFCKRGKRAERVRGGTGGRRNGGEMRVGGKRVGGQWGE